MLKVYNRPSCITLYPYTRGQVPYIEKSLGVFDNVTHKYSHFMYCFDKEEKENYGALKIPRGYGIDNVETALKDAGVPYQVIDRTYDFVSSDDIDIEMKLDPKNDIQYNAIAFLDKTCKGHQAFLTLDVGMGKTYCAISHIANARKRAMIISFNLSYQWQERIAEYTTLKNGTDVINIVGTQFFEDVIKGKTKNPKAKIYLVTINTLTTLIDTYGKQEIQKAMDVLGIGIKIFDEAHTRYRMFNSIDLNAQVDETIYLTATPGRSREAEDRMYTKIYMSVPAYGSYTAKMNNHYIINYIVLDSHATAADRVGMKTSRGLHSLKYTRFLMDKWFDPMMRLIMSKFEPILKEDADGKVLIVTDWLQDIQNMKGWVVKHYPQYSCGTYCLLIDKKAEREKELTKRIIIGTVGSMQNGKDIANLRAIIPLTQFSSPIVTRQLLGRLRKLKDKHVYYWDIADRAVFDTLKERRKRDIVFRDRAANEIREEHIDLERY